MSGAVLQTELPGIPLFSRGKVRDIYNLDDALLIVATDRISAYDVVLPTPIPGKGRVLTQMSYHWFEILENVVENHLYDVYVDVDYEDFPELEPFSDILEGRSIVVHQAKPILVECAVRGYITGSGWKDYQETGAVCGIELPPDLVESQQLEHPVFTPATKAQSGHDENISFAQMVEILGDRELAETLRRKSLLLYALGADYAYDRGIIIADTKFEFGFINGELNLIDEVLTPDSSRFWPLDKYEPGRGQDSFDKQYVRDYLTSVGWDRNPPAPELPDEVVAKTTEKYQQAEEMLTG